MEESQRAPAGKSHKEENAGKNLAVRTTGPWAVDSGRGSTTSNESDKPRGGEESESEEEDSQQKESNNPSGVLKTSEHARLNKVEEEGVASGIQQLTLQDESWLTQLPQNNKQNPWLVTLQDLPDGQGPKRTASRSRQPILTNSMEEI